LPSESFVISLAGGRVSVRLGTVESSGWPEAPTGGGVRRGCVALADQYHPGGFAQWSTPQYVVISGSRGLGDLPAIESVKHAFRLRGAEVFHTAEDGCVRLEIGGGDVVVTSHRPHVRATSAMLTNSNLLQTE